MSRREHTISRLRAFLVIACGTWLAFGASHSLDRASAEQLKKDVGRVLVEQGRLSDGVVACVACHRGSGEGDAESAFGNLTGLTEAYLAKQLSDYRSGVRENRVMQVIAAKLTDADIAALASYYSKLAASTNATLLPEAPMMGVKLAEQGDQSRALPACISCHGNSAPAGDNIPNLSGQHALYISRQLEAWQAGARHNDPGSIMSSIAKQLTPEEISAVALYFARQSRKTN